MLHKSIYQKFRYVDTNALLYLFRMHVMSFCGIETSFKKILKKDLNNISVVYHKAIERICVRNSYDSNDECLEYARLPIFKHFLVRKFICFAHRLFTSKRPCLMVHKHYLKYKSFLRKSPERFFSENYQVIKVFVNPLFSILSRIEFVQRTKPR